MITFVKCPLCGKKVEWSAASPYRPFCSERCKQIDLGAWANEEYKIPVTDKDGNEDGETGTMPDAAD